MVIRYLAHIAKNGNIDRLELAQGVIPEEGTNSEGYYIKHIPDDLEDPLNFLEIFFYDFELDSFMQRPEKPNPFAMWMGTAWDPNHPRLLKEIRKVRNEKLMRSDWTQISDASITEAQKAEAVAYRQALRDVTVDVIANPEKYPSVGGVNWPTPPSFLQ